MVFLPSMLAAAVPAGESAEHALAGAMRRALGLALRPGGRPAPNPNVGAVALAPATGAVLAEGFHRSPGEPHAEVELLRAAAAGRADLAGATLACTLEPCTHHGRTPPCAPQVAAAGFARVALALRDPNPLVNGQGVELLRASAIEVVEGVGAHEAGHLTEGFRKWIAAGRPFVHLKVAMLPDGTVHRGPAQRPEITGVEARRLVHAWRHLAPAVLVGTGTVRVDDPRLTARDLPPDLLAEPWQPRRVVLTSRFDVAPAARALGPNPEGPPPLVIGWRGASSGARLALERAGVETVEVAPADGGVDLGEALAALGERGVTEVLVEAGPTLAAALLEAGLVDRLSVFVAEGEGARPTGRDVAAGRVPEAGGSRRWIPPGGLPFTGSWLADREELVLGRDRLVTGRP